MEKGKATDGRLTFFLLLARFSPPPPPLFFAGSCSFALHFAYTHTHFAHVARRFRRFSWHLIHKLRLASVRYNFVGSCRCTRCFCYLSCCWATHREVLANRTISSRSVHTTVSFEDRTQSERCICISRMRHASQANNFIRRARATVSLQRCECECVCVSAVVRLCAWVTHSQTAHSLLSALSTLLVVCGHFGLSILSPRGDRMVFPVLIVT